MKVGLNTYEQRPQFKASFAKTAETKKALRTFCNLDHYRLYELKTVLKKARVKDIIEVSMLDNGTKHPDFIFKNTANDFSVNSANHGYRDGISNLLFSNGKSVEDYEPAPLTYLKKDNKFSHSRIEKKLREEADTVKDFKAVDDIHDIAFDLEERYSRLLNDVYHLQKRIYEKEKAYLMKELDLLD